MRYKLGEICEIVSGSTPKTGIDEYWDGDVKWITPAELNEDSYIITDSVRKITKLGVQKTGLSPFPKGTVILSSRAPIGKVAIAGCEMYCNQGFKNLICSEKINNKYLYWFLKGNTAYLNSLGRGATFKEISKSIVSEIQINVPDIDKQEAAVANLEKASKIISLRKKELAELNDLIKARFVELFDNEASENKFTKLSEVCESITAGGDRPKDTSDIRTDEYPYPVFANAATNDGLLCFSREYKIDKPCVTIAARGCTVGFTAIRTEKFTPVVRLISLVPNEKLIPIYLKYFIDIKMSIEGNGAAQPQVTIPMIKDMEIKVPSVALQNQFADFVKQVDKSKSVIQEALDQTHLLFDSLMQRYFG